MKTILLFLLLMPLTVMSQGIAIVDVEGALPGNLTPWEASSIRYQEFLPGDCAVAEGCASLGVRKLMTFSVTIYNPSTLTNGHWYGPTNGTNYEFDACHGHFHLLNFSRFELINCVSGATVSSRKQGWCVRDFGKLIDLGWNTTPAAQNCASPILTPGWGDTYDVQPCMYFDVTGLPNGYYTMKIQTDPDSYMGAHYVAQHEVYLNGDTVGPVGSFHECGVHPVLNLRSIRLR